MLSVVSANFLSLGQACLLGLACWGLAATPAWAARQTPVIQQPTTGLNELPDNAFADRDLAADRNLAENGLQFELQPERSVQLTPDRPLAEPIPFYNLLSAPEEPGGGAFIRVGTSSKDIGLLIYGRVALDTTTSNGRLQAPFGYIFLSPRFEESQWTNAISARQSTLGFLFTGPQLGSFRTLARFETYFLSSVTDANVYGLAQYYLYAKLLNDDWALTGGVTNTLVNPLNPNVLNASAGSDFGNLGFMRPQLRVERFLDLSPELRVTPQMALSSPVGTDFFQTINIDDAGLQLGEENGWPNVETRLGFGVGRKAEGARYRPLEFGFSGMVGELRFIRSDFASPAEKFETLAWMYGADIRWQVTSRFALTAEGWYGKALGSYAAGNKQTFNRDTGEGIPASGGFVEAEYKFTPKWIYHIGFMHDNPLDRVVPLAGRTYQQNLYTNLMYVHNRYLQVGFEFAQLQSGFKNPVNGDNEAWVVQNKLIFTF